MSSEHSFLNEPQNSATSNSILLPLEPDFSQMSDPSIIIDPPRNTWKSTDRHTSQTRCRISLIAPLWPQCLWFSEVLQLSAPIRPLLFPKLLAQSKGKFLHPNLLLLNPHTWELLRNQLEIKKFRKTL